MSRPTMSAVCLDCLDLQDRCYTCSLAAQAANDRKRGDGKIGNRASPERQAIHTLCQHAETMWRVLDSLMPYAQGLTP